MAINRAEKEALDQVCVLASPSGDLRNITEKIEYCAGSIMGILNSNDIVLPEETEERMKDSVVRLNAFSESYKEKAMQLAECNRKLSSAISTSLTNAGNMAGETSAAAAKAKGTVEEVDGGVK